MTVPGPVPGPVDGAVRAPGPSPGVPPFRGGSLSLPGATGGARNLPFSQSAPRPTADSAYMPNTPLVPDPTKVSHLNSHVPSKSPVTSTSASVSLSPETTKTAGTSYASLSPLDRTGFRFGKSVFRWSRYWPPPFLNQFLKLFEKCPKTLPKTPPRAPKAAALPTSPQSMPDGLRPGGLTAIWVSLTASVWIASTKASLSAGARWVIRSSRSMIISSASLLRARASAIWEIEVPPVKNARAARKASSIRSMTISAMISHFDSWIFIE